MDEIRERRRKRAIKVAITEGLMVFAVVGLVVASTMVAVGYNLNFNSVSIERTGLVALRTVPTGANIDVDGERIFGWTNMSRTMSEGEHKISLSRDGYESWEKNIFVTAGRYFRLNYPRLFLKDGKNEKVADFADISNYTVAPDEKTLLAVSKNGKFYTYKIDEEKVVRNELVSQKEFLLPEAVMDKKIEFLSWSGSSERVIMRIGEEIVVFNVKKPDESVNLTAKYGVKTKELKFLNDGGNIIALLDKGNLREINLSDGKISETILENVVNFQNLKGDKVAVTEVKDEGFSVVVLLEGEKTGIEVKKFEKDEVKSVKAAIGEYYGDRYVAVEYDGKVDIYKGAYDNLELMGSYNVGETAEMEVRGDGGVICFYEQNRDESGKYMGKMAIFDLEQENVVKITTDVGIRWIDEFLFTEVNTEKLTVVDYDGKNMRDIVKTGVSDDGEVKIARNERWMYYLGVDKGLYRVEVSK